MSIDKEEKKRRQSKKFNLISFLLNELYLFIYLSIIMIISSLGCEHQERFRSLYSTIEKSQYNLLSTPSSACHPPLVVFIMKKMGTTGTCSLLDCHVFAVRREAIAFELCDMIRKLIIKRTMSPVLPISKTSGTTLLKVKDTIKDSTNEKCTKYLNKDRPISAMEHRNADIQLNMDRKVCCSFFII